MPERHPVLRRGAGRRVPFGAQDARSGGTALPRSPVRTRRGRRRRVRQCHGVGVALRRRAIPSAPLPTAARRSRARRSPHRGSPAPAPRRATGAVTSSVPAGRTRYHLARVLRRRRLQPVRRWRRIARTVMLDRSGNAPRPPNSNGPTTNALPRLPTHAGAQGNAFPRPPTHAGARGNALPRLPAHAGTPGNGLVVGLRVGGSIALSRLDVRRAVRDGVARSDVRRTVGSRLRVSLPAQAFANARGTAVEVCGRASFGADEPRGADREQGRPREAPDCRSARTRCGTEGVARLPAAERTRRLADADVT